MTDPTPPAAPPRIVVVGDVATDVLAVLPVPLAGGAALATGTDTWARIGLTAGGSAANTAAWLATTGLPVTLVAAVGGDGAGTERLAELAAAGVDCRVRRHAGVGTGAVIVLSDPGERTMLCDRGANRLLAADQVDGALTALPDAAHLHLSGYPLFDASSRPAARHALAAARAAGLAEVGPTAFLTWITGTDLLIANLDEATVLTNQATAPHQTAGAGPAAMAGGAGVAGVDFAGGAEGVARRLVEVAGVGVGVVVKLGADGAVWADRGRTVRADAHPVTAVDPTGAGDAFAAGLLAAWLTGAGPAAALDAGAALGARAVTTLGARPPADRADRPASA
jgi:ribokinase